MRPLTILSTITVLLLLLTGCSQKYSKIDPNNPYPKHPRYAIFKPEKTLSPNYVNLAKDHH